MDARITRGTEVLVLFGLLLVTAAAVVGCGPGAEQTTGTVRGMVVRPPGRDPRSGGGGSDGADTARIPVNGDPVRARDQHGRVVASTVSAPPDGGFRFELPPGAYRITEDIFGTGTQVRVRAGETVSVRLTVPSV
ncbi:MULTISPECIES: hypothetical protein [Streptomyces]|uniref:Carboxypeptidase regulatory-like domain-containing protein n=1 Tax=Streptomyces solicathayae TaxID=3081768 RepID=A0ABZ0LT06_9ACTN|nr:hypothetical protein [Streptomyces sp. HUAS YS2]WOX22430.1 hypothetical protein R2D22_13885 [Streptomyces sp. HUAS YS2]